MSYPGSASTTISSWYQVDKLFLAFDVIDTKGICMLYHKTKKKTLSANVWIYLGFWFLKNVLIYYIKNQSQHGLNGPNLSQNFINRLKKARKLCANNMLWLMYLNVPHLNELDRIDLNTFFWSYLLGITQLYRLKSQSDIQLSLKTTDKSSCLCGTECKMLKRCFPVLFDDKRKSQQKQKNKNKRQLFGVLQ